MATKKSTTKKAATKNKTAKTTKARKTLGTRSFKLARADKPFLTFALTKQTLYWTIIAIIMLIFGLWIVHLQTKVNEIYDQIDMNQAIYDSQLPTRSHK